MATENELSSGLTQASLLELFTYDPSEGVLRWKIDRGPVRAGAIAGRLRTDGRRGVGIDGKLYYAHRLIWLLMTGDWPGAQIDHKNHVRDDNRWENLRAATVLENCRNRKPYSNNKSGVLGVIWDKTARKWRGQTGIGGGKVISKVCDSIEEAAAFSEQTRRSHFGDFCPAPPGATETRPPEEVARRAGRNGGRP